MKERPILFNAEMVRAILSGQKTQTRRPVSKEHVEYIEFTGGSADSESEFEFVGLGFGSLTDDNGKQSDPQWFTYCTEYPEEGAIELGQLFGAVGDRLWVRETWSVISHTFNDDGLMVSWTPDRPTVQVKDMPSGNGYYTGHVIYRADGGMEWSDDDGCHTEASFWKPSIHMPRSACRIILEITSVRVERVQDISESDAAAEGLNKPIYVQNEAGQLTPPQGETLLSAFPSAKHWFSTVWDGVYGNWSENPWVWVIEFKVLTTNGVVHEVAA